MGEQTGAQLLFTPYSPDLNKIELLVLGSKSAFASIWLCLSVTEMQWERLCVGDPNHLGYISNSS